MNPLPRFTLPLIASLLFACSFIAGKYAVLELGPLAVSLWRYVVASLFLFGLARLKRLDLRCTARDLGWFGLLGLLGVAGYHYFFFSALRYTAVNHTALINASNPIVTGLLAALLLGERLRARHYLGVGLAVAGVAVLLTGGNPGRFFQDGLNPGDGLMLLAVFSWGGYTLLIKRLSARHEGLYLTFWGSLAGTGLLLLLTLAAEPMAGITRLSLRAWLSILYMGVAASGIGYWLFNLGIARLGPTRNASFVFSCVPILVTGLSALVFGEPLSWPVLACLACVLAGLRLQHG